MKSYEVPKCPCPYCGYLPDRAGSADGSDQAPEPGDISMCLNCAEVLQFGPDLTLIRMDRAAWAALPGDALAQIVRLQNAHAAMKKNRLLP